MTDNPASIRDQTSLINHSYTVIEIERLRKATRAILFPVFWHTSISGSCPGMDSFNKPDEKVELQLRTYMLAGIRPEEVELIQAEREAANEAYRVTRPKQRPA